MYDPSDCTSWPFSYLYTSHDLTSQVMERKRERERREEKRERERERERDLPIKCIAICLRKKRFENPDFLIELYVLHPGI